ncbi:DNA-binding protein [Anaerosporomusa subterranea]|jgi:predicted transcriptional regulator YheO|uniref:DNA-binding protein n=1 Tax=Anaerosporomusa subterranea TaxID=1794912 RepID=A0A154BW13_ANASB|nr:PAS domain-containing protein [Anaerosporomusa subterranea]KYZ78132.1 DNA-binding protein [Anaerosporomusa subterranea]MDF2499831.1 YheO-like protein [Anaerosporomusa subterranea]
MLNKVIEQYIPIAQLIAKTFGNDCEVVIHDLEVPQNSVVYTLNNHVTGRQVGQSFDHLVTQVLLSQNFSNDCSANYYFHTEDGRLIKSSTVLLRDVAKKVVGALCVNLDTTQITSNIHWLTAMLPGYSPNNHVGVPEASQNEIEHITEIVDDLIEKIIGNKDIAELKREEKIDMIRFMEQKGVFLIKGAIDKVAIKMGISKVTVYSYIDEAKGK